MEGDQAVLLDQNHEILLSGSDNNIVPGNMVNGISDDLILLTPVQIQQEYFENLSDCDWVKYDLSNRNYLLQNVAFALFGSPSSEGELTEVPTNQEVHLEGYTSRQLEQVMKVYEKICEQNEDEEGNKVEQAPTPVTLSEARKCLSTLRFYALGTDTNDDFFAALTTIENSLDNDRLVTQKKKITDIFMKKEL